MGFPPLVFLHARALAHAARRPGLVDLWHLTGPALVAAWQVFGMRWAPAYGWTLDLAVMISTLAYGCGVFAQTRRDLHPSARHWLRIVTLWLFALVLIEIIVALELAGDTPRYIIESDATIVAPVIFEMVRESLASQQD